MTTHIAGIPHRNPNLTLLSLGDVVRLVPEPDNKFDAEAIRVIHEKASFLGYIPKNVTGIWKAIKTATITEISPERKWTEVIIKPIYENAN